MKYCIQRPFIENVTEIIKIWRFLDSMLSPLMEKKGEAEANGALYALRCDVCRRLVAKRLGRGDCFIQGKLKLTILTVRLWLLIARK